MNTLLSNGLGKVRYDKMSGAQGATSSIPSISSPTGGSGATFKTRP